MKKKFLVMSLASAVALSLCACGKGKSKEDMAAPSDGDENAGQTATDDVAPKDTVSSGDNEETKEEA